MHRSRTIILLAILLTLAYHFLIAHALKLVPPSDLTTERDTGPDCMMISDTTTASEWEQELYRYIEIANPTLMSLPDYSLGFSVVQTPDLDSAYTPVPAYSYDVNFSTESPRAPMKLPIKPFVLDQEIVMHWRHKHPPPPEVASQHVPNVVVWRQPNGNIFEHPPKLPLSEIKRAAAIKPVSGLTQVTVTREGDLARLKLTASCGNARLDQFVLNEIGRRVSRFEQALHPYRQTDAAIFYPKPGEQSIIEVEWRFADIETEPIPTANES